ncbi:hydantoinase/oxoprolinase N-terminal domain-containing protein [Sphingomonas sp. LM7]|uniref:hydantoinase/oxoprolinase N-terminal domain-containing protein n=1 Tax=Sphingomonas sp. LM7 TaxID=1938607 RepID=UPI0009839072|nr:hydantoinase/oxoprolinase family protein [Sphingomonas sp. LM7]AQR73411.1 hydantoinase subunit beta [Sphingomonas sp. LM7]
MRIGVDVGGTNTDAVLMDGGTVFAWTKQPTTADVGSGVAAAIAEVLSQADVAAGAIASVMVGTTHFTNALVERNKLDQVGILRLASPSGEALPPMTGWPTDLAGRIGSHVYLLPGGYEVDGREIAPLDETKVRAAARELRAKGVNAIAISSVFAPVNSAMEERAAVLVHEEHPEAAITLSHAIGRIGFIERENAAILNAALGSLAARVVSAFERALVEIGVQAPLYISQNDGTLISAQQAAAYPVLTIGSGPTNSMRGAAFLTGVRDAIVLDVGGTTTDVGVLANGFPRESSVAVDIGGARTNFRMPDILAIGLGGGTRIHLDPSQYQAEALDNDSFSVGPDSVGFRIVEQARVFGGDTLTASDIAVAADRAQFGDPSKLPALSQPVIDAVWTRGQAMIEEAIDRMKTSRGDAVLLAVGGGNFLIPDTIPGAAQVIRPPHAAVANAVGAAIAQVGAQIEQVVSYDREPRDAALDRLRGQAREQVIAAGGVPDSVEIVELEEVFLSYLPGRAAQVRVRVVADLAENAHVLRQENTESYATQSH